MCILGDNFPDFLGIGWSHFGIRELKIVQISWSLISLCLWIEFVACKYLTYLYLGKARILWSSPFLIFYCTQWIHCAYVGSDYCALSGCTNLTIFLLLNHQINQKELAIVLPGWEEHDKMVLFGDKYSLYVFYLDILNGVQEDCSLTVEQASNYPHCKAKMDVSIIPVLYFSIW